MPCDPTKTAGGEWRERAVGQVELCMIGDSITWANEGDAWRRRLLPHMPELAFVGTHAGKYGYSHAGEGGNTTTLIRGRMEDRASIPDCRYYHLLAGINDCAAPVDDGAIPAQAEATFANLAAIAAALTGRPGNEKLFLGTILPCTPDDGSPPDEAFRRRDRAGAAVNQLLRERFATAFPAGRTVLVDYEREVRPRPDRAAIMRMHPTEDGYGVLAGILSETLRRETRPAGSGEAPGGRGYGVPVENLWYGTETYPLFPGWYVVSFAAMHPREDTVAFSLRTVRGLKAALRYAEEFRVPAAENGRVEAVFFTGYENVDYTRAPLALAVHNAGAADILVEKMRPSLKASAYAPGAAYLDAITPPMPGERRKRL